MRDDELMHEGVKFRSGRYPYGSGENPYQHDKKGFYKEYKRLQDEGLSAKEIAEYFDTNYFKARREAGKTKDVFNSTMLRAYVTAGKEETLRDNINMATKLRQKGMGPSAIGKRMGVNESTVRGWLEPGREKKLSETTAIANALKSQIDECEKEGKYLDIGKGTEIGLKCSDTKLKVARAMLKDEGYVEHIMYVPQIGVKGANTTIKVMTKPDVKWADIMKNIDQVRPVEGIQPSVDKSYFEKIPSPVSIGSDRIKINYREQGGIEKDGLIEINPNAKDLSLGKNNYAQVRIAVDGDHYLKGMAVYGDPKKFPKGTDIIFNTNKHEGTDKMKVLKEMEKVKRNGEETDEIDWDKPFGASIKRVNYYEDKNGERIQSPINIVNEDENWETWSKNLASQFLSKQYRPFAKRQLQIAYDNRAEEFDNINKLTNPTLKKKLLEEFAESCDSDSVTLKAAPVGGQATHVILPMTSLKDGEIYAANYDTGEKVALIRYPHEGVFQIPILTVNNNNKEGKKIIGSGKTAVGINHNAAEQLSGADFDGDTVVVLPLRGQNIKAMKPLKELEDFDDKEWYKAYPGMPKTGPKTGFHKGQEMGQISNLITDMTLQGAPPSHLARAVRYSMTVIDAEKHNLDWRKAFADNGIPALKEKYQGGARRGASTLISKASAEIYKDPRQEVTSVNDKRLTPAEKKAWLNGEKIYKPLEGKEYLKYEIDTRVKSMSDEEKQAYKALSKEEKKAWASDRKGQELTEEQWKAVKEAKRIYKETGEVPDSLGGLRFKETKNQVKTTRMADTKDAYELSSGHPMEEIYAEHANKLKALANQARSISRNMTGTIYNSTSHKIYAKEVASLADKLKIAESNAPLERQATMIANKVLKAKVEADPSLRNDRDAYKKAQQRSISDARAKVGSKKTLINITDDEWKAIQAGAVSNTMLTKIFNNTDDEKLKRLATPHKDVNKMSTAQISRAKRLLEAGNTQAEVAKAFGVSVSTINKLVNT